MPTSRNSPAGKPFDFIAMVKTDTQLSSYNNCFNTLPAISFFRGLTKVLSPYWSILFSLNDQFRNHLLYFYSSTNNAHKCASVISMSAFFAAAKRQTSILSSQLFNIASSVYNIPKTSQQFVHILFYNNSIHWYFSEIASNICKTNHHHKRVPLISISAFFAAVNDQHLPSFYNCLPLLLVFIIFRGLDTALYTYCPILFNSMFNLGNNFHIIYNQHTLCTTDIRLPPLTTAHDNHTSFLILLSLLPRPY